MSPMDRFLDDDRGPAGPLVLTVESAGTAEETHVFERPFVIVGRDPRCDLRLDHPEVSERHAYLQLIGGRLVCVDLGSRGGVSHAGRRGRLIDVGPGLPLRIGPFRLRWPAPEGADAQAVAEQVDEPAGPIGLEVRHRGVRPSRCELAPGFALVGSGADCAVRIVDPSVSDYHASLVRTGQGVWVVDLLGQDGVRVNGRAVGSARIGPADTIELGRSSVRFASEATTTASTPVLVDTAPEGLESVGDERSIGPPSAAGPGPSWEAMLSSVAALHDQQTDRLKQELDQLRDELRLLRAELRQTRGVSTDAPPAPPAPTRAEAPTSAPAPVSEGNGRPSRSLAVWSDPGPRFPPRTSATIDDEIHARLCDRLSRLEHPPGRWRTLLARLRPRWRRGH